MSRGPVTRHSTENPQQFSECGLRSLLEGLIPPFDTQVEGTRTARSPPLAGTFPKGFGVTA